MLFGLFLAPSVTIGIEYACEVGFPVGEAYSNGMINISGNLLSIGFTVLIPMILDEKLKSRSYYVYLLIEVLVFLCFICICLMEEKLNRINYEKKKLKEEKNKGESLSIGESLDVDRIDDTFINKDSSVY